MNGTSSSTNFSIENCYWVQNCVIRESSYPDPEGGDDNGPYSCGVWINSDTYGFNGNNGTVKYCGTIASGSITNSTELENAAENSSNSTLEANQKLLKKLNDYATSKGLKQWTIKNGELTLSF